MNAGVRTSARPPPTWRKPTEALPVIAYWPHLVKTLTITSVVGTVLFAINHLDVVLRGDATTAVWVKSALTYLVPFCVSNLGLIIGSRRPDDIGDH